MTAALRLVRDEEGAGTMRDVAARKTGSRAARKPDSLSKDQVQQRAREALPVRLVDHQIVNIKTMLEEDRDQADRSAAAAALDGMRKLARVPEWTAKVAPWLALHGERLALDADLKRTAGRSLGGRARICELIDLLPAYGGFLGTGREATVAELTLVSLAIFPMDAPAGWPALLREEHRHMTKARALHGIPRSRRAILGIDAYLREQWPAIPIAGLRAVQRQLEDEIAATDEPDKKLEIFQRRKDVLHLIDRVPPGADALPALPDRAREENVTLIPTWLAVRLKMPGAMGDET